MDGKPGHALPGGQLGQRDEMTVVGVDATRADEAHDVEGPAPRPSPLAGREECRSGGERAVRDRGIDARQVLEDRATRTEVEVTDLRVAHLAGGRPTASSDARSVLCGHAASRPRQTGIGRSGDGVTGRVAPDPEPVEHDEHDGARPGPRPADDVGHETVSRRGRGPGP